MKVLVLLQNAYFNEKHTLLIGEPLFVMNNYVYHNIEWKNLTQKRIEKIIPFGCDIVFGNATNQIGDNSKSFYPFNREHCDVMFRQQRPDVILFCGNEAKKAVTIARELEIPYLSMTHPAARGVTSKYLREQKKLFMMVIIKYMMGS